jgi:hypothetical protein
VTRLEVSGAQVNFCMFAGKFNVNETLRLMFAGKVRRAC